MHDTDRAVQIIRAQWLELGLTQEEVTYDADLDLQRYQRFEYGRRRIAICQMRLGLKVYAVLHLDS